MAFTHQGDEWNQDFATMSVIQELGNGQPATLVFRVTVVENKTSEVTGEPYTIVNGYDMEGMAIEPPLYLWRYEVGEIESGHTYMARGMKVVANTQWCPEQCKYVPRDDGSKKVECTWKTALEDVSNIDTVLQYFG